MEMAIQTEFWTVANVKSVRHAGNYSILVENEDGLRSTLDMSYLLDKPFYAPLRDKSLFEQVYANEACTVSWGLTDPDNSMSELDVCPGTLYARSVGLSQSVPYSPRSLRISASISAMRSSADTRATRSDSA